MQQSEGKIYRLRGRPAELESERMLFRADQIDYDDTTGDVVASGHVYFHSFEKNEEIWCDHLTYNTEDEKGKFYEVRGETHPKVVARRGVLMVDSPFHFEGKWAERVGERYLLYDGWVTNCQLPNPWWRLRGPKFDILPGQRAKGYRSIFMVRKMPLLYAPFFYHSLEKEPRHSGFLIPSPGHSTIGGFTIGLGYFWAINRSYDVTYRLQDYISRAYAHHLDFRGKPSPGSSFDVVLYGVNDRGAPNSGTPPQTFSGLSAYAVARSDLGHGWSAGALVDYTTSFRFRQEWTQSFNEAIGAELDSAGFVNKNWSTFTFDAVVSRLQNFLTSEIQETDAAGNPNYLQNAVNIRKLPEGQLATRDRRIWKNLPLWFSFESDAGLLYREEPIFQNNVLVDKFQTNQFLERLRFAPHMTSVLHWGDFSLIPSAGLDGMFYSQSQAGTPSNGVVPSPVLYNVVGTDLGRVARDASVDLVFPSFARVFQKKTIFGEKLKHVVETRATYRYVTGIGTDFNRFIRFDENDLLTNTNELQFSLTNRIYAKRRDSVQEIFTWELTQKRYFDPTFGGAVVPLARNVFAATADLTSYAFAMGPRSYSPIVSLLRTNPIGGLGIQWQADYDPYLHGIVDSSLSIDYRWKRYLVSAGNNAIHSDPILIPSANQYRFRVGYGDANHRGWNAAVDAVYDYKQHVLDYSTVQVTYNTDCCGLSVQYRRYNVGLRDESQYSVAFAVANIGTFGTLKKQDRLF
jgi:LPS-assembly protein